MSKCLLALLFCALPWQAHFGKMHDFHLSKSEVHYNAEDKSIEISIHLFIDDLELAINGAPPEKPFLYTSDEMENADSLIAEYLNHNFSVLVNGEEIPLSFVGREEGNDYLAIWCYLQGVRVTDPKEITIQNRILVDHFRDQKNIVVFTSLSKKEFMLFDEKKIQGTISL